MGLWPPTVGFLLESSSSVIDRDKFYDLQTVSGEPHKLLSGASKHSQLPDAEIGKDLRPGAGHSPVLIDRIAGSEFYPVIFHLVLMDSFHQKLIVLFSPDHDQRTNARFGNLTHGGTQRQGAAFPFSTEEITQKIASMDTDKHGGFSGYSAHR